MEVVVNMCETLKELIFKTQYIVFVTLQMGLDMVEQDSGTQVQAWGSDQVWEESILSWFIPGKCACLQVSKAACLSTYI